MTKMLGNFVLFVWSKFKITSNLAAENLALRQQLVVMERLNKRPKIRRADRFFWVVLSRIWTLWRKYLVIVKPDTVVHWHRTGFKLFWKFKGKGPGRPRISRGIRDLVRRMAAANPSWGSPRIHGELLRLGFEVYERTVSNLMPRRPPNSKLSQTWRTFLENHANKCSIDFFTVPTAECTAQQIVEAFPWDTAPKYLMRDRDEIYGAFFRNRVKNMGIKEVVSAPQSPWQNPFTEQVIGSIRRECSDHVIVLNEAYLKNIFCSYFAYYHKDRTHLSLEKDSPDSRPIQPRLAGKCKIIALPQMGGLYHRYEWKKAA